MLGEEFSKHLKEKVPRKNYQSDPEWVRAIKHEVDEVMLPGARAEIDPLGNLAAKAAEFITSDRILEDLTLEERLDSMVDRAMRRLAQMKFMKQFAASSASDEGNVRGTPLLQVAAPSKPLRQRNRK
jgi:hypothetical protein